MNLSRAFGAALVLAGSVVGPSDAVVNPLPSREQQRPPLNPPMWKHVWDSSVSTLSAVHTLLKGSVQKIAVTPSENFPPLHDHVRFSTYAAANDALAFNRAYRQHVEARQSVELHRFEELQMVLQETDYLYTIWRLVRDGATEHYQVPARRKALDSLREALGEEAYYAGKLPPHVPLWRFQEIDR